MPDCMRELRDSGLHDAGAARRRRRKPLFGVCVGMQMLLDRSEEGPTDGLGLIPGEVLRFRARRPRCSPTAAATRCRRWAGTRCAQARPHPVWAGVPDESYFYFVHSFYARPADAAHSAGEADYGGALYQRRGAR